MGNDPARRQSKERGGKGKDRVCFDHVVRKGRILAHSACGVLDAGLLVVAIEEVLAPSVDRFELFTGPRSEANVRLYERLGYERIATPFGHEPLIYLAKPARPDLGG